MTVMSIKVPLSELDDAPAMAFGGGVVPAGWTKLSAAPRSASLPSSPPAALTLHGASPKALHDMEKELLLELHDYLSIGLAPENYWKTVDSIVQLKSKEVAYAELKDSGVINVRVDWLTTEDENDAQEMLSALSDYLTEHGVPAEHLGFEYNGKPPTGTLSFESGDITALFGFSAEKIGGFYYHDSTDTWGTKRPRKAAHTPVLPEYRQLKQGRGSKGKPKRW